MSSSEVGNDLVRLEDTSPDGIARLLQYKLVQQHHPFTRIHPTTLILVNPQGTISKEQVYSTESAQYYADLLYRNYGPDPTPECTPHLYELVTTTYFHLRRLGEDQSIVFSGSSGSGKTEALFQSLKQLQLCSHQPKKPNKLGEQIPAVQTLLESFGQASSHLNSHASRLGLYMESQFNNRGRMIGLKTLVFHLEKNLIVKRVPNFKIFYQLISSNDNESLQLHSTNFKMVTEDPDHDHHTSYSQLVESFKVLGIKNKARLKIFQVLAAILHLSNLEFQQKPGEDMATPVDVTCLQSVASLLGVNDEDLEQSLARRSQLVGKEMCTQFLNPQDASIQRDTLMTQFYSLLVTWIVEAINGKLCQDEVTNFVALLDGPGLQSSEMGGDFERLASNFIAESIQGHVTYHLLEPEQGFHHLMIQDGIQLPEIPSVSYPNCYPFLTRDETGLIPVVHQLSRQNDRRGDNKFIKSLSQQLRNDPEFEFDPTEGGQHFILHHYVGPIRYNTDGFIPANLDGIPPEFIALFRDSREGFIQELFSSDVVQVQSHPDNQRTLVSAQSHSGLLRQPSRKQPRSQSNKGNSDVPTRLSQLQSIMEDILATLDTTRQWSVLAINPSLSSSMTNTITDQVSQLSLPSLSGGLGMEFSHHFLLDQFVVRYQDMINSRMGSHSESVVDQIEGLARSLGWRSGQDYVLGETMIFLSIPSFKHVEDVLRHELKVIKQGVPMMDDNDSVYSGYSHRPQTTNFPTRGYGHYGDFEEVASVVEEDKEVVQMKRITTDRKGETTKETVQNIKLTRGRKYWMRITWMMTWWIPTPLIKSCGMTRPDVQMAWREKVTICLLIFWSWAVILFVNIGLGLLLCPANKVWKPEEIATLQGPTDLGVYMYGIVYDITNFSKQRHGKATNPAGVDPDTMLEFGGKDVTTSFPIPLTVSCAGLVTDNNFKLWTNISDDTASSSIFVHDSGPLTQYPATPLKDPNWFFSSALTQLKNMKKGEVVYDFDDLTAYRKAGYKQWGVINNRVYDLTSYVQTQQEPQFQTTVPGAPTASFLPNTIYQIFDTKSPAKDADLTNLWNTKSGLSGSEKSTVMKCLDRQFFIGTVDQRGSLRCQVTNILLLVSSGMILLVTLVKFLAALQLTSRRQPMDCDKFVICQVPCYTEGEDSIRRTLESLALLDYKDQHKLIFVIADGMIIGSGNDRPTPKIVLDVLGVDPDLDPESFAFQSIGEGSKQLNYGKIYSGLFQVEGRSVPYIVAVKVGKPGESGRPGNRGKRDSQILLMNFLNRVHFDSPMCPLDLEIYHQLKNVIGVDPKLYEYILMVDADTEVFPDSLTRLIAVMTRDGKIIGLCGETQLSNENQSITTMMQVYEYYISHHLAKAFESLFGAVTCLPGCFCMYRIRTTRGRPLIVSNGVIHDYSENIVDTLHMKNLLHLGEDRYLTTLMLKHFPEYKMKFTPDAQCRTVAPERFEVLLSQRRRWINSTIHNLFELIFLNEMCGFCCFSMRFVVFLDLVGTLILPATVIYLVYVIVAASTGFQYISYISIIIMCSTYFLQALIFILKQQWQHIGWMVFYLLGMALFNFYIPIYSYWHFDDFSWGNTRVVVGDDGMKQVITQEEEAAIPFDKSSIPMIKWSDHEQGTWELGSQPSQGALMNNQYPGYPPYAGSGILNQGGPPSFRNSFASQPPYPGSNQPSRAGTPLMNHPPVPMRQLAPSPYLDATSPPPHQPASRYSSQIQLLPPSSPTIPTIPDHDLYTTIQSILQHADLMHVTKKQIRHQLAVIYPDIHWDSQKDRVSALVDRALQSQPQ